MHNSQVTDIKDSISFVKTSWLKPTFTFTVKQTICCIINSSSTCSQLTDKNIREMELERLLYLFIVSNCVVLQCITSSPVTFLRESRATYLAARQSFLDAEERMMIGENLTLSVKEETANKILMGYKIAEINASRNGVPFPPSMHFFKGKPLIQKSKVFKILSKMPKGE